MNKLFPFAIWPHNAGLMKAATARMPFAGMRTRDVHEMMERMAVAPRDTFGPIVERPHRTQASDESSNSIPMHIDEHTPRHGHFGPAYVAWFRDLPVGSLDRNDVLDDIRRGRRYDFTPEEASAEELEQYGPQAQRQIEFGLRTVHDPKSHAHIFHAYLPPGSTESWLDPKIHQPIFDALKEHGIKSIQINVPNSMKSINVSNKLWGSGIDGDSATPDQKQEIIKQELLARRIEDLFHKQTRGVGATIDPDKNHRHLTLKDLQDFTGANDRPVSPQISSNNKKLLPRR